MNWVLNLIPARLRGWWAVDRTNNTIMPSPQAVAALVLLAPVGLLIAGLAPRAWALAPALGAMILVLVLTDCWLAGKALDARAIVPTEVEVGAPASLSVLADITGKPREVEAVLALDPRLAKGGRLAVVLKPDPTSGAYAGTATLSADQRCTGALQALWLRWHGPLGLGVRQHRRPLGLSVRVVPDLSPLRSPEMQALLRDADLGLIARRLRGDGTLFEALSEYQPGMDRRRIDWKVSARHARLHAREYEAERNNRITFAIDCGQAMCDPVGDERGGTLSRLDRAITAALACSWVALKGGDKVALFGFASRVMLATPFASGTQGFAELRRAAAGLEYTPREPNFTLALATLAAKLERRSLVVVFSDFTDPTSAALMAESIGRLVARHHVVFVAMADTELEAIATAPPATPQALAEAVSADLLLRQRALVLARLRQSGVDVLEAPYGQIGPRLIDAYLALRQGGEIG